MKSILSFLIILSGFISQEISAEDIIYIFRRPPFSDAGIVDSKKIYYDFTNARPKKCDLKIKSGCFIKTNIRAEVIKKGIIKVGENFACSGEIILSSPSMDWIFSVEKALNEISIKIKKVYLLDIFCIT